jgi:hypothetical protein
MGERGFPNGLAVVGSRTKGFKAHFSERAGACFWLPWDGTGMLGSMAKTGLVYEPWS